jgi:hypothetical protein
MRSFNIKKGLGIDHDDISEREFEDLIQSLILADSFFMQLLAAIHDGDLAKVKTCISAGVDINTENFNVLSYAVRKYWSSDAYEKMSSKKNV